MVRLNVAFGAALALGLCASTALSLEVSEYEVQPAPIQSAICGYYIHQWVIVHANRAMLAKDDEAKYRKSRQTAFTLNLMVWNYFISANRSGLDKHQSETEKLVKGEPNNEIVTRCVRAGASKLESRDWNPEDQMVKSLAIDDLRKEEARIKSILKTTKPDVQLRELNF
jgi:hypothetical protein